MEFTPITTQEDFDRAIVDRLKRERESISKKFSDYDELKDRSASYDQQLLDLKASLDEMSKKTTAHETELSERDSKIQAYETASLKARIAHEKGIPYELSARLTGSDEKQIRDDAEALAKLIDRKPSAPPLKTTEPATGGKDSAYKNLLTNLQGE